MAVGWTQTRQTYYAWFPALRFRSSVQMGSNSVFFRIRSVRDAYAARKRQRGYGTAVRTRIMETVTETDERRRNAGSQALEWVI